MAVQLHEESAPGFKSELDLFSVPPTQVTTEHGHWAKVQLCNPITNTGPYKFMVSRDNMMLDLNKNFLYIKMKITAHGGAGLQGEPEVAPINYLANTFFKQVIVKLGDKEVYNSGSLYMYQAYLETLLNYGGDAKEGQLTGGLWHMDTNPDTMADNPGFAARGQRCRNSDQFELIAPIHCDIFNQERYMLGNIPLSIELHRNDDAFCLQSVSQQPSEQIRVLDMCWYVRKVKIQDSLGLAMEQVMREQGMTAKYPIRRVKMVNRHISEGTRSVMETNLFNGQLPRRIIFGLVSSDALNGSYTTSPFNFKPLNMSEVCVWMGDLQYGPWRMNYHCNCYNVPFEMLYQGCNMAKDDKGNRISYSSYKDGNCLYVFDLTPDNSDSAALQLLREGSVNIEMRFDTALNAGTELIVYGEFDNLITIDWNRNIFFDYSL